MFFLYNLLLLLTAPFWLVYVWARRRGRRRYFRTLARRFGGLEPSLTQTGGGAVWLHAVSVGEVLSCRELLAELRIELPGRKLLVSTATATGQEMAGVKLRGLADGVFYAPLDFPFAARRVLARIQPRLVIVAETEIWPNLYREVKRSGASLLVVNARISDRSAPRYRRLRFFFRRVLRLPDAILAQSELDRERLVAAGAPPEKVEAGGNLKFDSRAGQSAAPAEIVSLLARLEPSAVVLAGSTREGEERQVLAAWSKVTPKHPRALLILAPRHPERFEEVARLLTRQGFAFARRSRLGAATPALPVILLLDSLGELASLYPLAQVVFVGGSLVTWGGHNVVEPAQAGRAIVVGPHMQNFRAIAGGLLEAGGMLQVRDAGELAAALERLLDDPREAAGIGERAQRWAESQRGASRRAAERAAALYHQAIPDRSPATWQRLLLWLPARLWEGAARLRGAAYDRGRIETRRLQTPTVSVGALTAGGAGKTPVVLWLAGQLQARGMECAVLTRGYRRSQAEEVTILEPGSSASPPRTGDEAQLLLRNLRVPVGIAADRHRAGAEIERRFHPDVIVLDDGFQHRRLARDLDVVVVDVTASFGGGDFLPLGRLREPPESLARADVILLTRASPGDRWEGLRAALRRYNPRAPILLARFEPAALVEAATETEKPLGILARRPVTAFCAVGNPDAFWRDAAATGAELARRRAYRDHHQYAASDVRELLAAARDSRSAALLTTEKDIVNLWHVRESAGAGSLFSPLPLYWLKTRVVVEGGERLIETIEQKLPRRAAALPR